MSKYLITGGAGFIGSAIVRKLLSEGEEVRVLDNFSSGKRGNLSKVKGDIEMIEADVRASGVLAAAVEEVDYVLHHAAEVSVPESVEHPVRINDVNAVGTLKLLEACRNAGVRRLVLASSASVYGESDSRPLKESKKCRPLSPYALTKLIGEEYCRLYSRVYGIDTVCLRYFNVYGPRQDPGSPYAAVVPKFFSALLGGRPPVIYGDGEQTRDFIYVEDVADINYRVCLEEKNLEGKAFNIAGGTSVSIEKLCRTIADILNTDRKPETAPERRGEVKHSRADISRTVKELGFEPAWKLRQGLEKTARFYRK